MKALSAFAGITLPLLIGLAWLGSRLVPGQSAARAIWLSAAVAFVVQLFTFATARLAWRTNVWAAWGLGAMLRFLVLVVYGVLAMKVLGLPLSVALLSLAAFFFVSTLIEPLLLTL
ncbi:MAG TPA: hypothetical protein VFK13_02300 [Gemmatimonadaceae bacterium]|nr:hypothetical protein [Gemmatimonadaceae bacterium]